MSIAPHHRPEQLRLLEAEHVPVQLRLDERTRRVGLAGIAAARAVLADNRRRRIAAELAVAAARRPRRAA
jgi:hypothetical protein